MLQFALTFATVLLTLECSCQGLSVDLDDCHIGNKGCLRVPEKCSPLANCSVAITWRHLSTAGKPWTVRFELAASLRFPTSGLPKPIEYIAFGLAPNTNFMSNSSVTVCGFNARDLQPVAFHMHLPDQSRTAHGLKLVGSAITKSHLICVIDREVWTSKKYLIGNIFPLHSDWFPSWAVGDFSDNEVGYHAETKRGYKSSINVLLGGSPYSSSIIDFEACFRENTCIRNPEGCSRLEDCEQVIAWGKSPESADSIRFQMLTIRKHRSHDEGLRPIEYLAFGVTSDEHFMLNSSVVICGLASNDSKAVVYYAHSHHNSSSPLPFSDMTDGLSVIHTEISPSRFLCIFDRNTFPTENQTGYVFPLNQTWHPAWAVGSNDAQGFLSQHYTQQVFSKCNVDFTQQGASSCGNSRWLAGGNIAWKLHGFFMMIGWMVFIASGTLTPRYLKGHWNKEIGGSELWLLIHRTMMLVGITFVIAGFMAVFIANNFLAAQTHNPYPVGLDWISMAIPLANAIGALFRCRSGHQKRYLFNCIHGAIGGVGFLVGMGTIALGMYFMKSMALYSVLAWVVFHVAFEFLFFWKVVHIVKSGNGQASANVAGTQGAYPVEPTRTKDVRIDVKEKTQITISQLYFCYLGGTLVMVAISSALLFSEQTFA